MYKKNKGSTTIHDVAALAGVSVSTISRVFNRKEYIHEETIRKVVSAAKELDYRCDELDSLLDSSRTRLIPSSGNNDLVILSVPSFDNPFYNGIFNGAQASAQTYNFDILLSQGKINESNAEQYISMFRRVNAKGIISTNMLSLSVLNALNDAIPVVQCGEFIEESNISAVSIDDFSAARQVIEYILSLKRKKIAFLNGPLEYKYARERQRGLLYTLKENDIAVNQNWVLPLNDINADMAFSATINLFSNSEHPDAIFAASDVLAAGAIRAVNYVGMSVPKDVVVIGFDNITLSMMMMPSITTVNQPTFQMGYLANEFLFEKIQNPKIEAKRMLFDTELIIRESSSL